MFTFLTISCKLLMQQQSFLDCKNQSSQGILKIIRDVPLLLFRYIDKTMVIYLGINKGWQELG